MTEKYLYHGMDITLDVYEKIRTVVEMLAEKEQRSFDEMYLIFAGSRTYTALEKPDSLMWAESAEFIVDEYDREVARGRG